MTDVEILLLVVAAIYLSECVVWLDSECQVFTGFAGRMRCAAAPDVLRSEHRRLFILSLLPATTTLVTRYPSGLFCHRGVLLELSDRSWQLIPYQDIIASAVTASGDRVRIGERSFKVGSSRAARQQCRLIQRLAQASEPGPLVDARLQRYTDPHRAGRRIHVLRQRLLVLQQLQLLLLMWILPGGSVLYYLHTDPWQTLLRYLLVTSMIWAATVSVAWCCSRRLQPARRAERWKELFLSCVSPMHAVRASDRLSLDALGDQHPLAVAVATMPRRNLVPLAKQVLAELRNPLSSEQRVADHDPETRAALNESRQVLTDALAQTLSHHGIDIKALEHPDQQDQEAIHWCPRCFDQYTIPIQDCPNCPGIPARKFPEHKGPCGT